MTSHSSSVSGAIFEQDGVGDTHLADVVQQGAAADVNQIAFADAGCPGQGQGRFGDAQGVAFGLVIPQVQGARPAHDGIVVGHCQADVGALQAFEHLGVVDGDGGLAGEGSPGNSANRRWGISGARWNSSSTPFTCPFGHQRHGKIGNKLLTAHPQPVGHLARFPD